MKIKTVAKGIGIAGIVYFTFTGIVHSILVYRDLVSGDPEYPKTLLKVEEKFMEY